MLSIRGTKRGGWKTFPPSIPPAPAQQRLPRRCPAEAPRLSSRQEQQTPPPPPPSSPCGVSGRCCVILSTPRSGSSHESGTFRLLCFVSVGRRSGYCCRKLLLFLCSVDQLFPSQSLPKFSGCHPLLCLPLPPPASLSLLHAVCLARNPRRRLIMAAPSNTNSWDFSVAFADVY